MVQDIELDPVDKTLIADVDKELAIYFRPMDMAKLRSGQRQVLRISELGNTYLQKSSRGV